jgi:hypothetical protein
VDRGARSASSPTHSGDRVLSRCLWRELALDLLDGRCLASLAECVLGLLDLGAELPQAGVALLRGQLRELLGLLDEPGLELRILEQEGSENVVEVLADRVTADDQTAYAI